MKDVRPYYATSDLFLLLSYGEGFPNTLLEAWAMELPVVVSNHPPYPEITNSKNLKFFDFQLYNELSSKNQ